MYSMTVDNNTIKFLIPYPIFVIVISACRRMTSEVEMEKHCGVTLSVELNGFLERGYLSPSPNKLNLSRRSILISLGI